jgi:hypothetical protein
MRDKKFSETMEKAKKDLEKVLDETLPKFGKGLRTLLSRLHQEIKAQDQATQILILTLLGDMGEVKKYKEGDKLLGGGFRIKKHKARGVYHFVARKKIKGKDYRCFLGNDLTVSIVDAKVKAYCKSHSLDV